MQHYISLFLKWLLDASIRLSLHISREQFVFLSNRQIHDAIAATQECIHYIHSFKKEAVVMKIDLHKAYNCVDWSYIRLILYKVGLRSHNVEWIMACTTSVCFVVLINGLPSTFFCVGRELGDGCSLSPLIFILVMDGLSLKIKEA